MEKVKVIGAGLAGSEAAWQIAEQGVDVILYEMRPVRQTQVPLPAHWTRDTRGSGRMSRSFFVSQPRRSMVEVILDESDRLEWGLRQFRRKMLRSGRFKDMKKKRFYEKPSVARRRKAAEARRRMSRRRGR